MGLKGCLVRTNQDDHQEKFQTQELAGGLSECGVIKTDEAIKAINSVFEHTSTHRGQLFWEFNLQAYCKDTSHATRIAVWGMKGQPQMMRKSFYAQWYMCAQKELQGDAFFHNIFGTVYLTEEQVQREFSPELLMGREGKKVDMHILSSDKLTVCHVLQKLWEAQLESTDNRLIIKMSERDEEKRCRKAMALLRELYLLLPPKLRMSMGFAVNVSSYEILELTRFAFHIFFVSPEDNLKPLEENTCFYVFDMDSQDQYLYDEGKMQLLTHMAECGSDEISRRCLACLERRYVDSNGFSSFKFLQEMYLEVLSGDVYWWKRRSMPDTLETLKADYEGQGYIMADDVLRSISLDAFYKNFLYKGDYGIQIKSLVLQGTDSANEILEFCSEKLRLGLWVDTLQGLKEELERQYEQKIKDKIEEENKKIRWNYDNDKQQWKRVQTNLKNEIQEQENLSRQLRDDIEQLQKDKEDLKKVHIHELEEKEKEYTARLKESQDGFIKQMERTDEAHKNELEKIGYEYKAELEKIGYEYKDRLTKKEDDFKKLEESLLAKHTNELQQKLEEYQKSLEDKKKEYDMEIESYWKDCERKIYDEKQKTEKMAYQEGYKNIFVNCKSLNNYIEDALEYKEKKRKRDIILFFLLECTMALAMIVLGIILYLG